MTLVDMISSLVYTLASICTSVQIWDVQASMHVTKLSTMALVDFQAVCHLAEIQT